MSRKIYEFGKTPDWKCIEISGKELNHPLTVKEYQEAYKKWIPKDNIPFDKLFDIVFPQCTLFPNYFTRGKILAEYENIFNQIKNGLDRKENLILFLKEVDKYYHIINFRELQKKDKYFSYYKNNIQKIQSNLKCAKQVQESLITECSNTETIQLKELLEKYINQSNRLIETNKKPLEPLEIKDYKLYPRKTKKTIQECLNKIINKFNISIDSYLLNVAIESL